MSLNALMERVQNHFKVEEAHAKTDQQFVQLAAQVVENAPKAVGQPVLFFNASTRLAGVSLNAAFSILTAHSLRLQGVPVVHLVCERGMSNCVGKQKRSEPPKPPPCRDAFIRATRFLLRIRKNVLPLHQMQTWISIWQAWISRLQQLVWEDMPLGKLVLPSARLDFAQA